MASIDKAAMVFSIAIALVGVGIAVAGNAADNAPTYSAPVVPTENPEPEPQADPFANIAEKVKSKEDMMDKETVGLDEEPMMEEPAGPTNTVDIPLGTSVPGCEENNACYLPADITINAGDTVEWTNIDTAAHTVTNGNLSDGPSDVFDSGLIIADASYAFTFDDAGSYDYFCIVHPWMTGSVTVN